MTINTHGGPGTCVVDQFEATDLGAPFKVILHKSVKVTLDAKGAIKSYSIPDLDGLVRTVAISRILCSRKLNGADIRFIRRSISVKQKDMARKIEMSAEHLSRCEAGALAMSPTSEKLLRIFALATAMKLHKIGACEAKTKLEDALETLFDVIKPVAVHDVNDKLVLHFHRSRPPTAEGGGDGRDDDGQWDGDNLAKAA